jgi:hypothetical protein
MTRQFREIISYNQVIATRRTFTSMLGDFQLDPLFLLFVSDKWFRHFFHIEAKIWTVSIVGVIQENNVIGCCYESGDADPVGHQPCIRVR